MKTGKLSVFGLLLGLALSLAGSPSANAGVLIYKVTVSAKAKFFAANSVASTGYIIIDPANVSTARTVNVIAKNKTYIIDGGLKQVVVPTGIGFSALDKNGDNFFELQIGTSAFASGNVVQAVTYLGAIPKNGFRLGNTLFTGFARSLKGTGSTNVGGTDFYTRTDTFTIDPLSGANPADTTAGLTLVTAQLAAKHYTQTN